MLKYTVLLGLLVGVGLCLSLAVLALRRKAVGASIFAALMLAVADYAGFSALELTSPSVVASLRFVQLEYLGMAPIPALWLMLTLRYVNRTDWLERRRVWLFWIIPLIVIPAVWTNSQHHLFFVSADLISVGPFYTLVFDHGPFHWLHTIYGGLALILSSLLLLRQYLSPHAIYRRQVTVMLIAGLWVILFTSTNVAGVQFIHNFDLTPFAILIACGLLGWGLFHYRLIDLSPIAREALFAHLADAALVLDAQGRLVDFNLRAQQVMGLSEESLGRRAAERAPGPARSLLQRMQAGEDEVQISLTPMSNRIFEVQQTPLNLEKGVTAGRLLVIHDVTERVEAQKALKALNADLEQRVSQRTLEYLATIDRLEAEVAGRTLAEQKLEKLRNNLLERLTEQSRKLNAIYEVLLEWEPQMRAANVMSQSLERVAQVMDAQAACFHERQPDGWLRRSADWGLSPAETQRLDHLPGTLLDENPAMTSLDLAQEKRLPSALHLDGYQGYLAAPLELRDGAQGLLQLFYRQSRVITVNDFVFLGLITEQLAIILENVRLRQVVEQHAAQQERQRLARDLHDSVTQSLHSLAIQSDVLRYRLAKGRTGPALQTLQQIEDSARQSLKEMRLLLYEMRLAAPETIHWLEMLRVRLEAVEGRANIAWTLDAPDDPAPWPAAWEPDLYAITTEALNNALKYSGANQVSVWARGGPDWLRLVVQDDGRGFDLEAAAPGGIGLQSMRERAEQLGARLVISSQPGQGTQIELCLGQPEPDVVRPDETDSSFDRR